MERNHTRALPDRDQQSRNIAAADNDFRVALDEVEIQLAEQTRRTPLATHAQDRADSIVGKRGVDVGEAVGIAARQVAMGREHMRADAHPVARTLQPDFGLSNFAWLTGMVGRRNERNRISGSKCAGFDHRVAASSIENWTSAERARTVAWTPSGSVNWCMPCPKRMPYTTGMPKSERRSRITSSSPKL